MLFFLRKIFYDDLTGNKYEVDRIQLELDARRCEFYYNDTAKLVREKSGESIIVTWNNILSWILLDYTPSEKGNERKWTIEEGTVLDFQLWEGWLDVPGEDGMTAKLYVSLEKLRH